MGRIYRYGRGSPFHWLRAIIHNDGGSVFNGAFVRQVLQYGARHRIVRPYKKNEQVTSGASTELCGRKAWGGPAIEWQSCPSLSVRPVHF